MCRKDQTSFTSVTWLWCVNVTPVMHDSWILPTKPLHRGPIIRYSGGYEFFGGRHFFYHCRQQSYFFPTLSKYSFLFQSWARIYFNGMKTGLLFIAWNSCLTNIYYTSDITITNMVVPSIWFGPQRKREL